MQEQYGQMDAVLKELNKDFAVALPAGISPEEMLMRFSSFINQLIQNDFQKLISLLYRIDVSEKKLKHLLKEHQQEDAGKIIASLVVERQLQKMKTRQQFRQPDSAFEDEERW